MKIIDEIEKILFCFQSVFTRERTFNLFIVVVLAFVIRTEFLGVTSIIRTLNLEHNYYKYILDFFHSQAYNVIPLMLCWFKTVIQRAPIYKINDHSVILGDTICLYKAGKKIPGVVNLHNSSQQLNKPKHFWGHCYGFIAILTGNKDQQFATPIMGELHQGISTEIREEQGKKLEAKVDKGQKITSIILMISMAVGFVKNEKKKFILVLDAFYFAKSVFENAWECVTECGTCLLTVVIRGKINAVGYLSKIDANLKNNKIRVRDYFTERSNEFKTVRVKLYGEMKTIKYYSIDLYWNGLTKKIRFVLVIDGSNHYILTCSNVSFLPVDIIKTYSHRVKIETMFDKLKNVIGGFDCRFWSKYIKELRKTGNKKERKAMLEERGNINEENELRSIASTVNATECFVNMAGIALGILQIIALKFHETIKKIGPDFKRTESSEVSSVKDAQSIVKLIYTYKPQKFVSSILYRVLKPMQRKNIFSALENC